MRLSTAEGGGVLVYLVARREGRYADDITKYLPARACHGAFLREKTKACSPFSKKRGKNKKPEESGVEGNVRTVTKHLKTRLSVGRAEHVA
jgi:hypothetical protein